MSPFLQVNSPKIGILGQNTPAQDVLGRTSENLMDAQQQTSLRGIVWSGNFLEFWTRKCLCPVGGSNRRPLKCFAGLQLDADARFNSMTEHALTEYRDQLTAFDQTIQEYQDMLDGKAALPEDMTTEQVQAMLDLVRETRAQFLQDGGKEVNRRLAFSNSYADEQTGSTMWHSAVLGESFENAGKGADFWRYSTQMRRTSMGKLTGRWVQWTSSTQTCSQGLGAIATELKRRGYDDSELRRIITASGISPKSPQLLCSDMNALVERTLAVSA